MLIFWINCHKNCQDLLDWIQHYERETIKNKWREVSAPSDQKDGNAIYMEQAVAGPIRGQITLGTDQD